MTERDEPILADGLGRTPEREHVPSLDCWCKPHLDAYGDDAGEPAPVDPSDEEGER